MNYEVSGEFDEDLRIKNAALRVVRTYSIYAVIGLVFLFFLWFRGTFNEASGGISIRGFVMAISSAFGLLQIILFLGYGLVNVPRQYAYLNSLDKQVNMTLCKVDTCDDRL